MGDEESTVNSCENPDSSPRPLDEYPVHLQPLILFDKNKSDVICGQCGCIVLRSGTAKFVKKSKDLPMMHKKSDQGEFPCEPMEEFWFVDDMYAFENVGFSNTIGTIKFLVCADCEEGPIGFHDTESRRAFYVAISRVKHDTT